MISVAELNDVHLPLPQIVVNFTRYFLQSMAHFFLFETTSFVKKVLTLMINSFLVLLIPVLSMTDKEKDRQTD